MNQESRIKIWLRGIVLASCFLLLASAPKAEAATIPLNGYAWSETIGWIHFCSDDPCTGSSSYKVLVETTNGAMSGYAWSENLGWLSFNSSETSSCGSAANLNMQSGVMDGWAKWLSSGECIHLKGSNYGVTYSSQSNQFSGFAWGDENTGWMQWRDNNPNYGVYSESPIVSPPEAPTSLTATAISQTRIDLAWTDNSSGETGFKIERKTGAGGAWSQITQTNPNVTSYQNSTGLSPNSLYFYRVRATNNGGDSAYSNESSTSTLPLTSTIDITMNPTSASWTLYKDGVSIASGTGNRTDLVVYPTGNPSSFSIVGGALSGYDAPTYSNTQGSGSAMALFGNENVGFTVTYAVSFNYSLSNGGNVNVQKGGVNQSGQTTVTKTLSAGSSQSVDLSVAGHPSGVSYSIANNPCNPTCPSTITFTVTPSASAGTYPITVTGSPLGKTTNFNLVITNSPDMFISCTHDAGPFDVGEEVTWTANITQPGAGAPYTFSWTGTNVPTPSPATQSFAITYTTTGTKTVLATVRDRLSNVAVCSPQGTVNIGVNPTFEEF